MKDSGDPINRNKSHQFKNLSFAETANLQAVTPSLILNIAIWVSSSFYLKSKVHEHS